MHKKITWPRISKNASLRSTPSLSIAQLHVNVFATAKPDPTPGTTLLSLGVVAVFRHAQNIAWQIINFDVYIQVFKFNLMYLARLQQITHENIKFNHKLNLQYNYLERTEIEVINWFSLLLILHTGSVERNQLRTNCKVYNEYHSP